MSTDPEHFHDPCALRSTLARRGWPPFLPRRHSHPRRSAAHLSCLADAARVHFFGIIEELETAMRRTIVEAADVSGDALTELKNWLGITRPNEDDLLVDLLSASLAMCEAFTGQVPLSQLLEERLPASAGSYLLTTRPVATAIATVELVAQDGSRAPVAASEYTLRLADQGSACFQLLSDQDGQGVAVRVRAGIASVWSEIPAGLKQGLIRLAAYLYRDRDRPAGSKADASPPASVAALWRPWRVLRLA